MTVRNGEFFVTPPKTEPTMNTSPPLEHDCGVALWRQIQQNLQENILSGTIPPGETLPPERILANRFGVNRHTVRRAIAALCKMGLLTTRQGYGTFVPEAVIDYALKDQARFSEAISAQSDMPSMRMIASSFVSASPTLTMALKVRKNAQILCIRTVGEADGRPVSVANHYFAARRFKGLETAITHTGSVSEALKEFGIANFSRQITNITARLPSREDAHILQQPPQRPVLLAEGIHVTPDGKPLAYERTQFAGDRVQMVFKP